MSHDIAMLIDQLSKEKDPEQKTAILGQLLQRIAEDRERLKVEPKAAAD